MRLAHLLLPACLFLAASPAPAAQPAPVEHFEKHVRPLLVEKCISCHGPKAQRGKLRLDHRAGLLKGGEAGPSLVPGHPEKSLLMKAVRREGDLAMPPKEKDKLDAAAIAHLETWIRNGAPYPGGEKVAPAVSTVAEARKSHWAFRPVARPAVPEVKDPHWGTNVVDRFVLAKLEGKGLTPSAPADARTLLRRLSFDLTGLPPTPEEVEAFAADARPDAYERAVGRLLGSPAYGERWGRHWLDVARYADTKGYVFQEERRYPFSYTYRDYVVNALNADLPYDEFVVHQIAADQLPLGKDRGPLAAMGFLTLGRRFLNNTHDIIDDRIDVVTRGLMGLTAACARCHDHKYDPISSRDYYSLYGVFASSAEPRELPLLVQPDASAGSSAFDRELQARQAKVNAYLAEQREPTLARHRARAADYLVAAGSAGRQRFLNPAMVQRWRAALAEAGKKHHPVLSPFVPFTRIPSGEFAAKAPALATRVAANKEAGKPVNPLVAKAFAGKAPSSLGDVAKRYGALFEQAEKAWTEAVSAARKQGKPAPAKLANADLEAVRQVLYGPQAPTNVPQAEFERFLDRAQRNRFRELQKQVDNWRATGPGAQPRAMVLNDNPTPFNPVVFLRGNPGNRGPAVPRQFPEVLDPARKPFTKGSGRLELAKAIADPKNPLTARVMVNRIWMHHFGQGLVRTPGDFGTRGEAPTHPELLDWLASELVESGWSLKHLHRLIVTSATYRQSSADRDGPAAADPENLLLWRMNRRRLEFEPLRDAMLSAADRLDRRMGGPAVDITVAPYPPRRSVYAFIERQNLPGVFRTFDLASPDVSTPQRHATTVPQQSLFLMNSPFVQDLARGLASRPDVAELKSDEARIGRMVHLCYGRPADPEEVALGLAFVRGAPAERTGSLSAWEQYAQVLLLGNELAFVD